MIDEIYARYYRRFQRYTVNVFLCGKDTKDPTSIRSKIEQVLAVYQRVNVIYPEWLFSSVLDQPESDLLTLEHILALSADFIVLPLEGPGALVELGAFASSEKLVDRLVVLNEVAYKKEPSFINKGPLKVIRRRKPGNLHFYDEGSLDETIKKIRNQIVLNYHARSSTVIDNLFDFANFLELLVAFLQPISLDELQTLLIVWNAKIDAQFFRPSLELLLQKKKVRVAKFGGKETVSLSELGASQFMIGLSDNNLKKDFTSMRTKYLWTRLKKNDKVRNVGEWERLLD